MLPPHAPGRTLDGEGTRTTWYDSVEEMQTDLDAYIQTYNRAHPHPGRGMEGRTPHQVFMAGIQKPRSRKKSTTRGEGRCLKP